jgi:hypothetical protein
VYSTKEKEKKIDRQQQSKQQYQRDNRQSASKQQEKAGWHNTEKQNARQTAKEGVW